MRTPRTIVVTTMSLKGYELYGHRFWDSYLSTFPPLELAVYSEDELPIPHLKLTLQEDFVKRNRHRSTNNFKYDAVRFCYKPYAIKTAYDFFTQEPNNTRLLWIDSDTVFKQRLTEEWITKNLYDQTAYLAYLGRPNYHSETGLLLFNTQHPYTKTYINQVVNLYNTDNIYTLPEWHDSYIWDYVRELNTKEHAHNISKDIPKVPGGHILNYCFGDTLDHLKGKRKQVGYSKEKQRRNND